MRLSTYFRSLVGRKDGLEFFEAAAAKTWSWLISLLRWKNSNSDLFLLQICRWMISNLVLISSFQWKPYPIREIFQFKFFMNWTFLQHSNSLRGFEII